MQLFVKSAEIKLMDTLAGIRGEAPGWHAVHFHLSDLLEEYKSEYQVKIAINLIHDLLKHAKGFVFLLADQSIIVMCYGLEKSVEDKLVFQLRYLYMDDPLAYTDSGQENPDFCRVYHLGREWQDFFDLCARHMEAFDRKHPSSEWMQDKTAMRSQPSEPKLPVIERPSRAMPAIERPLRKTDSKLSASTLARIEDDLIRADLQKVLRRQPVCAVLPNMTVRRVFDEMYIHITHLRQLLHSEVDFLSNRWLFKYLTRSLDERMIALIRREPTRYLNSPISLNLNVETLLSGAFTEFDSMIAPQTRVSIVIEVPVVDVFADMGAFMLARAEVQKLGYRVCLDGLTTASFTSINRERLGLDLLKVQWNADVLGDLQSAKNSALIKAVQDTGSNRIILCRCDNRDAVEYGHALGISLFQGRYIDSMLNPTSKTEN